MVLLDGRQGRLKGPGGQCQPGQRPAARARPPTAAWGAILGTTMVATFRAKVPPGSGRLSGRALVRTLLDREVLYRLSPKMLRLVARPELAGDGRAAAAIIAAGQAASEAYRMASQRPSMKLKNAMKFGSSSWTTLAITTAAGRTTAASRMTTVSCSFRVSLFPLQSEAANSELTLDGSHRQRPTTLSSATMRLSRSSHASRSVVSSPL